LDVGYSRAESGSQFRHYLDNNNLPIQQTTTFERVPITANLRWYLTDPGRSIGKLAWIPNKIVPWVGGGVGTMWYRFSQEGDFVDFSNLNVFTPAEPLSTSDWTVMGQGMAGVDVSLTPTVALTADARYLWARATPGGDFNTFSSIDLSGVAVTLGLTFRL
jgi:hypothetical protein